MLIASGVKSQDFNNYNLYMQNPLLYNPAYTFNEAKVSAFVNTHLQWVDFTGAPQNNAFGVQASLMPNMGFGIWASQSKQGLNTQSDINLGYAYRALIQQDHYITFGLTLGTYMEGLNYNSVEYSDMTDSWFVENGNKTTTFAARFGLSYYIKGFELQVAMPQLYRKSEASFYTVGVLSYNWLINDKWSLKPAAMMRGAKTTKLQYDGTLEVTWNNQVSFQAGYRSNNSLLFAVGYNFKEIGIGYGYQYDNNLISNVSKGTHEIQLFYRFKPCKKEEVKEEVVEIIDPNADKVALIVNLTDEKYAQAVKGHIIISKNGSEVQSEKTGGDGKATIYLTPDVYDIRISAKGFLPLSETVDLSAVEKGGEHTYKLQPIKIEKGLVFKYGKVNFETASDKLTAESLSTLDWLAEAFNENKSMKVEIAGHSDSKGNAAANKELSKKRAQSVANYLISKGVDEKQLVVNGYGSEKPIDDNNTEEGRANNRRVEFTVLDY